ncbi:MAG: hypothetical protein JWM60_2495 [Solirubrobacterales bacterium]|nr:hypothetical protein [Solirubrobacterales bacterium]
MRTTAEPGSITSHRSAAPSRSHRLARRACVIGGMFLALVCAGRVQPADAAAPSVAWKASVLADPYPFSYSEPCRGEACDRYQLLVRNVGEETSSGNITMTDLLPVGVSAKSITSKEGENLGEWLCGEETVATGGGPRTLITCTYSEPVHRLQYAAPLLIALSMPASGPALAESTVTVQGGGAASTETTQDATPVTVGTSPSFDFSGFAFSPLASTGALETQAGGHPSELTVQMGFTNTFSTQELEETVVARVSPDRVVENARDLVVELPLGLVGNPQATPRCPERLLSRTSCPVASRVGNIAVQLEGNTYLSEQFGGKEGEAASAIYNVEPEAGFPAEFAFTVANHVIYMYASVVNTASGYRLRVAIPGIYTALGVTGATVSFFGDPKAVNEGEPGAAFLTNPAECSAAPLQSRAETDSWEAPSKWIARSTVVYPAITGCERLSFDPSLSVSPVGSGGSADAPSGFVFDLVFPQHLASTELPEPPLRGATIKLPAGVAIAPPAAVGLTGCPSTGPGGFNQSQSRSMHEPGLGEAIGPDGLPSMTPGRCPGSSQVGTVEVFTPLLPDGPGEAAPLSGALYLTQPRCGGSGQPPCTEASAVNGELYGVYLEAVSRRFGVVVKLEGEVHADPATGQITVTFADNPQFPVSHVRVRLREGPKAPLATPETCGAFTTLGNLTSWSAPGVPPAQPDSTFAITQTAFGAPCPPINPFALSLNAGTQSSAAGSQSSFAFTLGRSDAEQTVSTISTTTPRGLLGDVAAVKQCAAGPADAGSCTRESEIGHVTVAAGAGSEPLVLGGRAYLTGPYKGAPFGLSIVVPAVAGPFNLGNVVVRAAIQIDPITAAITVVSDPLPQLRDGVPVRLKEVHLDVDRPGFIQTPTNCSPTSVAVRATSPGGAVAHLSSPFAVTGCKALHFAPKLTATVSRRASRPNGVAFEVAVTASPGQANIEKVKVDLPRQLPSRLSTLQKACTEAVFDSNPASCPSASVVGHARAQTPILSAILEGPAILVSHGGAAFPDLVIVLQGEGVKIVLRGATQITKGVTSSTFRTLPDAPVSSFMLTLPSGPFSALGAFIPSRLSGDLCGQKLLMPTAITGQNGATVRQTTNIAVPGCKRPAKPSHRHRARHQKVRQRKARHR